ncbi:DNA-binding transcriptional LysR family regulator [Inquilinus ginsengisoli]|uniref:DNA-binding transcriptional LysR family regulator n=1 Tax=Inquilinus ginsengisoli TaxID=363840 RepID=A0ABU1JWA8_9PROT|nr:LysR family transcriptional regulator [Inquilinus ginsengisoli]MDR6291840.1 DNA-binding transcriptional LysR family regulator [Inquilinus ginsengisoli]
MAEPHRGRSLETAWLEDFLAVLDEGGFSRAAERRGVSQPAFSRRIRALEDWVGTTLFDRSTHSVRLTPAGERFRPAAEEMLRRLQIGRQDALSAAQAGSETLRFAATHALALTFFPAWLRALEAAAPTTMTVQLTADTMVACERLMVEGRAQFLLCHDHPAAPRRLAGDSFPSIALGQDVLLPVAAPVLAGGAAAPYLAYTAESGMGRILAAAWAQAGRTAPAEPAFSSHLASVLAAMARDGRGISWSPLSLVAEDLESGRLARVGTAADEVPMEIRLFRPRARQSPAAETFWDRAVTLSRQA